MDRATAAATDHRNSNQHSPDNIKDMALKLVSAVSQDMAVQAQATTKVRQEARLVAMDNKLDTEVLHTALQEVQARTAAHQTTATINITSTVVPRHMRISMQVSNFPLLQANNLATEARRDITHHSRVGSR
jgi:hypothetical protein